MQTAADDRGRSLALDDLGVVLLSQGDTAAARQAYEAGLPADAQRLAAAQPTFMQALTPSAWCPRGLYQTGRALIAQGDLVSARKAEEDALAIARRLALAAPADTELQLDVGVVLSELGLVLTDQGDLTERRAGLPGGPGQFPPAGRRRSNQRQSQPRDGRGARRPGRHGHGAGRSRAGPEIL